MSNPIKYSASEETNSIKIGNFWIGAAAVDRGPSESTGYYQGYSPEAGGYVIYLFNSEAPGNLSYHNAPDDSELIKFTNGISSQSFTGTQECFDYYYTQTDKKLVSQTFPSNFPPLVMDGLVLYLDTTIALSYSGTGTSWNDINGLGPRNNGTLVGPTFNSGAFSFNGSSDYITLDQNMISESITISFWIKPSTGNYNIQTLFSNTTGGFTTDGIRIFFNSYESDDGRIYIEAANGLEGSEVKSPPSTVENNTWQNVCFTVDTSNNIGKIYKNSVEVAAANIVGNFGTAGTNYIGVMTNNFHYQGLISSLSIYNRILSEAEIQSNYNAQVAQYQ